MTDLNTTTAGTFDGAQATLRMIQLPDGSTNFVFRVTGIDPSAAGQDFGAHLHLGICRVNEPLLALGHYNTDRLAGNTPVEVSPKTEVWFDLVPNEHGIAVDQTLVPFIPDPGPDGERSIVIHAEATDPQTGLAGARQACLPLVFNQ